MKRSMFGELKQMKCSGGKRADLFCRDERCFKPAFLCKTCPCVNEHIGHRLVDKATFLVGPTLKTESTNLARAWIQNVFQLIDKAEQQISDLKREFLSFTERELCELINSDIDIKLIKEGIWKATTISSSELNRKLELVRSSTLNTDLYHPKKLVGIE